MDRIFFILCTFVKNRNFIFYDFVKNLLTVFSVKTLALEIEISFCARNTINPEIFFFGRTLAKNWSAKKVMERDCLYTRKSEEGITKCDRKATTAVWEVKRAEWRGF